jgi:hypothetical protein
MQVQRPIAQRPGVGLRTGDGGTSAIPPPNLDLESLEPAAHVENPVPRKRVAFYGCCEVM